jgi:hypothetical protein
MTFEERVAVIQSARQELREAHKRVVQSWNLYLISGGGSPAHYAIALEELSTLDDLLGLFLASQSVEVLPKPNGGVQ